MMGLLGECSDSLLHSAAWHWLAARSADLADAAAAWERSIECAREGRAAPGPGRAFGVTSEPDFLLGNALWAYAERLIEHGDFARAAPLLAESAALFQARGSRFEMADSLGARGRVALLQGDVTKARALLDEAVSLAAAFNYQEMLAGLQPLLGLATLYDGDAPGARRLLEASLAICLALNDPGLLAAVYAYLAETALREGEPDEAERQLAQSLAYRADPHAIGIFHVQRIYLAGRLAAAQGAYRRCAVLFGAAERARDRLHYELAGPPRRWIEEARAQANEALGPALFAEAFTAGEQLPPEEAFATMMPFLR
jgi:tetratricopeptide (TPR) repeat protein